VWTYRARLIKVIDGDTCDLVIDAGFRSYRHERIRLLGVNTPERKGATRAAGDAAKAFAERWFAAAENGEWPITVVTERSDAFGRYLGSIWNTLDGGELNAALLEGGHAVPYERRTA